MSSRPGDGTAGAVRGGTLVIEHDEGPGLEERRGVCTAQPPASAGDDDNLVVENSHGSPS